MSVRLRKRSNKDGTVSLILDIYNNGQRKREFLKHLQLVKPANLLDRENNKQKVQQADAIAVTRAAELSAQDYGMITDAGKKTIVTVWMQNYIDGYKLKDKRNMQGVLNRFENFLLQGKKSSLTFGSLNSLLIEDFIEYLESKSKGEGGNSYYARFKKMIKQAYRQRLIKENPLEFVERRIKGKAKKKEVLTIVELQRLSCTDTKNEVIKKAFIFCCLTGMRWVDIKLLKWSSIDLINNEVNYVQSKTGEHTSVTLNNTAIKLLGEKKQPEQLVFKLPTHTGAIKTLKAWVKRAKIEKTITWHCARHTFGTNLILGDVEIYTASKLLGHKTVRHTQRYVDTDKKLKRTATDKLNFDL